MGEEEAFRQELSFAIRHFGNPPESMDLDCFVKYGSLGCDSDYCNFSGCIRKNPLNEDEKKSIDNIDEPRAILIATEGRMSWNLPMKN